MLNYVKGQITDVYDQNIIVEVGGLGLSFQVPSSAAYKKSSSIELHTYMHWNQEQGPSLFGFSSLAEKRVFLLVIGCSGIGPKIALAVLNQLTPAAFVQAVTSQDLQALSSVSGIGPKKAEQLLVQLRHKVAGLLESGVDLSVSGDLIHLKDLSQALSSLNYSRQEITRAVQHVSQEYTGKQASFDELLRQSLSFLAKRL